MLTGAQVAERLGLNPSRVRQIGTTLGLGTKYGKTWVYTEAEVTIMEARKTTPGPAKTFDPLTILDEPASPPHYQTLTTLRDLAAYVVGLGIVTDPLIGEQTVVLNRPLFDHFAAVVDETVGDDPVTIAARALVDSADVQDTTVDVPVAAVAALDRALAS